MFYKNNLQNYVLNKMQFNDNKEFSYIIVSL